MMVHMTWYLIPAGDYTECTRRSKKTTVLFLILKKKQKTKKKSFKKVLDDIALCTNS